MSGYDPSPYSSHTQPNYSYTFYGVTGQKLAMVTCNGSNYPAYPTCAIVGQNVYFGKKLITAGGVNVVTDRLGSVRANGQGESFAYYPYGEERTNRPDGREKFGTYFRDTIGQDYADQRYYNAGMGRFWSPDPLGIRAADLSDPGTLNLYSYAYGDPVNNSDPTGLYPCGSNWTVDGNGNVSVTVYDCTYGGGTGDGSPPPALSDSGPHGPSGGGGPTDTGTAPASPQERLRDQIWMGKDFQDLKTFSTKKKPCLDDLAAFNLNPSKVDSIAAGTTLVNVATLPASGQSQFNPGMDMTAITNPNNGATFIVYNVNNFWQTTSPQMAGTLLHEIIHLANPLNTDQSIAQALGVTITGTNTSAISLKLAKDCF
jgi:RHS repeat-associated protein